MITIRETVTTLWGVFEKTAITLAWAAMGIVAYQRHNGHPHA